MYVKSEFKQLPGKGFYVAKSWFDVASCYKYKCLTNFWEKFVVWQFVHMVKKANSLCQTSQSMVTFTLPSKTLAAVHQDA